MKESYRTIEQVASYLQCSESHVFELVDTGSLDAINIALDPDVSESKGDLRISPSCLSVFENNRHHEPSTVIDHNLIT